MKNSEITNFKAKEVCGLFIIESPFGYFFVDRSGTQVQDPKTGRIIPSQENESWDSIETEKPLNSFLAKKVDQIIKRFLATFLVPHQPRKKLSNLLSQ